jgi:signal transduction histidine kinase
LNTRSKVWLATVLAVLCVFVVAALVLSQSFLLSALTDVVEALFLASGVAAFARLAMRSHGRMRLFWSLMVCGLSFWFIYQLLWSYYEVVLRRDVPDLFAGDVILFLNLVPMMAAIALRPHVSRNDYAARLGRLDFALLLVWWLYLYVLVVIPWQYVVPDVTAYNRNLNNAYTVEKFAFLLGLAACWIGTKGYWRRLYLSLFAMSLTYSASSLLANWAIARRAYYSGSFYDIPLASAMAWLTWIGLRTEAEQPELSSREVSTGYGVWIARCGMIAVFSLPLFAVWTTTDSIVPARIRVFRLLATFLAAFIMGVMVFLRQYRLDYELVRMLNYAQESFENLKRLQEQILQSEKLTSIGQLVGGAAHELNNPITAMLGYSDLLMNTRLSPEQQSLAARIGQDVRRTKSLVASLVSFAREGPAAKTPLDLNTLVRTAVKLTQPQWEPLNLTIQSQLAPDLPKILGNANQLLQVCLQLIANDIQAMGEEKKFLQLCTAVQGETCSLLIASSHSPLSLALNDVPGNEENPADAQGLSACQGILQEHGGQVSRVKLQDSTVMVRVELPAMPSALASTGSTKAGVRREARPFA